MGIALAGLLATFAAAHGALVLGLARRAPRWHALAAFAVPPLAAFWGWREGMRRRVLVWCAVFVAYAASVAVVQGW